MHAMASNNLLLAAIGGLLCVTSSCSTDKGDTQSDGSSDAKPIQNDAQAKDVAVDTGPPQCDGSIADASITDSMMSSLSLEMFKAMCDARHGVVEIHPHCGGENTCRGFSFDTGTGTLTEHECRGLNTCAGYSCIIC